MPVTGDRGAYPVGNGFVVFQQFPHGGAFTNDVIDKGAPDRPSEVHQVGSHPGLEFVHAVEIADLAHTFRIGGGKDVMHRVADRRMIVHARQHASCLNDAD